VAASAPGNPSNLQEVLTPQKFGTLPSEDFINNQPRRLGAQICMGRRLVVIVCSVENAIGLLYPTIGKSALNSAAEVFVAVCIIMT
jgi:hypothetical protein